ncbi:hypothetical protein GRI38_07580 [Altererythrobacter aurantiacus]|uniref:Uncharacterized protein n=1 Tax=Parapontixanthobacter aurantiacus TaxID=1463599 RepID=A0A844ZF76_9SPHN|nr:hypothetical protein [Parapontixanthobacter aurantiacus]MXO85892.1 hypothetical protein [Parapontixanthobacter aurantiacus]
MFDPSLVIASTALVGLIVVVLALLRAWHEWLELKRAQMSHNDAETGSSDADRSIKGGNGHVSARIELADLRERIKKLEAIASGVDL